MSGTAGMADLIPNKIAVQFEEGGLDPLQSKPTLHSKTSGVQITSLRVRCCEDVWGNWDA